MPDPLLELEFVTPSLADVPGVLAVVLGGSRARGTATAGSDYDFGLYFGPRARFDPDRLLEVVKGIVDNPDLGAVTPVGGWGPWIVGDGWLSSAVERSIFSIAAATMSRR
jgi:hypothetical protein